MAQVQFTTHSSDRLKQRFGVRLNPGVNVDISQTFKSTGRQYIHTRTGNLTESFMPKDPNVRMVIEVDLVDNVVITVMAEGPVVEAAYRRNTH